MTQYFWIVPWNKGSQFFDNNGQVLANGQIFTYVGGSFTEQQETFSTSTGTANTNPIVLDDAGRVPVEIYGFEGQAYNLQLLDVNGNQIDTVENTIPIEPSTVPAGGEGISVWNQVATPTFVSSTSFIVPGNLTTEFAIGNRVQFLNGTVTYGYGTVTAVSYSSPNTQVTLAVDSTTVGSNLASAWWSANVTLASGATVDADGVSFVTSGINYSNLKTVGGQLQNLNTEVTELLTPTGVTAGTYTWANVDVDNLGRLITCSSGMPLTTKGDLVVYTTGPTRLGVGTDGKVLTANSAADSGLEWQPPFNASLTNGALTNLVRTASDGFASDPELTVALEAGVVYQIRCYWNGYTSSDGCYMKVAYSGGFSAGNWAFMQANTGGYGSGYVGAINTQFLFGSGFPNIMIDIVATIVTTSAGNLSINWGNPSGGGSASITRYAGSSIVATQCG